jgi:hypothetical protein
VLVRKLAVVGRLSGMLLGFVVLSMRVVMRCLMVMMRRSVMVGRRQLVMLVSREIYMRMTDGRAADLLKALPSTQNFRSEICRSKFR